jgi:[ribosomal protein S5]-alanine N-acetyltransferase
LTGAEGPAFETVVSDAFHGPPPEISTARLRLRALRPGDSRAVHAYAFDPDVARFLPWRPLSTEVFAKGLVDVMTQPDFLNWAITEPPGDLAIGMVFLHSYSRQHRKAEIAFNLARSHWRRGLATEAAHAVLGFAFHELVFNRVEALCMPENLASIRVIERLGMRREGTMRRVHHRYDGFHDMELFALLSSDVPAAPPG